MVQNGRGFNEGFRVSAALMGLESKAWPFLGFPKFTLPVNLKYQGEGCLTLEKTHIFTSHFSKDSLPRRDGQFQNWNKGE